MSHRTTKRVAAATGFAVATVSLGMAFAPAALAAELPAVNAPGTVVAGEKFTVSGIGCFTRDEDFGATIGIITDSGSQKPEEVVFAAEPDNDGTWSAEVFFPVGDTGEHFLDISCLNVYLGAEEEQFYPLVRVDVTAPATTTPTPPPAAPKTDAPVPGAIRGTSANTPGVAAQTTGATTKDAVLGQKVVKVYKGFQPFEKVTLTMHSTPTTIGTFTATAEGVVTAEFTLPAGTTAGTHTLVLEGDQGTYFQESLQVAAATSSTGSLAYTGASVGLPLALGAGLLVAGGGALALSRRRAGASQV
ncbi:hypothetical protein ACI79P_00155 [Blastococcus sp. SYSU DS0510]